MTTHPTSVSLICSAALLLAPLSLSAAQAGAPSPCKLLTTSEVAAAVGWKPTDPKEKTYGTTSTCTFTGNALKHQTVVLVISKPAPKVASSAAFAALRTERAKKLELDTKVTPMEGLGAPAIRSEDEGSPPTLEAVVKGRVLGVSAATFEAAQALARAAIPRMR
jgi:hypothetical protein